MNFVINFVLISGLLLFSQQCSKEDVAKGTPDCIKNRIKEIANADVWNPPAKIYRYSYNGRKVFFIPQRCCDIPSQLLDEDCNVICQPDGGFSGSGDGACSDFFTARTGEQLIWEDDRKN